MHRFLLLFTLFAAACGAADATSLTAKEALLKAARFFGDQVSDHGGYLYFYSGDLKLREAEGIPPRGVGWVQPPGTPAIGEAFLDAWTATKEEILLTYARACAEALIQGQLESGGWDHSFDLDRERRAGQGYRGEKRGKKASTQSSLDDDITTAALRFLMRFDEATKDPRAHEAASLGLKAVLAAQYPNGAWYQWWKEWPQPKRESEYPIKPAEYPDTWLREWDNKWTGRYFLNDNVAVNVITTLLLAHELYGEEQYLSAARRGGDFLILAQMPSPQPAWAQQYDPAMHPVWDRKFEPPAVCSRESERVLLGLIRLYHYTGDTKYLQPHDRAIDYLKSCALPDGRLPRYRELRTNKPLYFEVKDKMYHLTYDDSKLPKHYGFKVESILPFVQQQLTSARQHRDPKNWLILEPEASPTPSVADVIAALDSRGAWVEKGHLDQLEITPDSGIISCATFIRNLGILADACRAP